MFIDITPLRISRDYRLLFFGQLISAFGSAISFVVLPVQVYQLTGSTLLVGFLSASEFVLILLMAFVGGAYADFIDKRKMLRLTEIGQTLVTVVLVTNALLPAAAGLGFVCGRGAARRIRRFAASFVRSDAAKTHSV